MHVLTLETDPETLATSQIEIFMTKVNGLKPLTIVTKILILDVIGFLGPPLTYLKNW